MASFRRFAVAYRYTSTAAAPPRPLPLLPPRTLSSPKPGAMASFRRFAVAYRHAGTAAAPPRPGYRSLSKDGSPKAVKDELNEIITNHRGRMYWFLIWQGLGVAVGAAFRTAGLVYLGWDFIMDRGKDKSGGAIHGAMDVVKSRLSFPFSLAIRDSPDTIVAKKKKKEAEQMAAAKR